MKHASILLSIVAITTLSLCFCDDNFHDNYHRNFNLENPVYFSDDGSSTNPDQPPFEPFAYLVPIDTSRDNARERIHNQCDECLSNLRFSCPTYSEKDINVLMCSSWSVTDFERAVEHAIYKAMQKGKSRSDFEQDLLRQYEFYRLPAFRDYIKTLSAYRPHIKELRDRLVAQKSNYYRVWRALGFLNPEYVHKLDLAEGLYAKILEEEQEEHRIAQQKLYQKVVHAQQELQRKQETTRTTFDQQRETLQQLSDEWLQIQDIYQDFGLSDDGRYERRHQALHAMTNNGGYIYETKSYTIPPETAQLMRNMGSDDTSYQACYGNQLQQVIHQEYIDGLHRLASLPETSVIHPYKESITHCFDAAREYNQAGTVDKATMITDFCWSLLDYGKAIAEGAVSGVVNAVQDTMKHPGQALLCAVAGEYVLAYQLSKVLYNVADIGVTYTFDAKRGKKKCDDYVAPIAHLVEAINNKELSLRDGLKGATQFAVQWKTQGKLLKGMNKFYTTAKTKALEFAKNNPLALPQQYMTTPEGVLLQSTHNVPTSGSSFKYELSGKFFVANEREIAELTKTAQTALQPSQEVLQVFSRESLNTPEKFLKHIFAAELKEKKLPNGAVKKSLAGFHHYMPEHLEEMNIELLNPRTCERTGLIIADVLCDGHLEAKKTFFPVVWSRKQVISKLGEAVRNPIKDPKIEGTKGVLFGRTSEGIVIRTIIDIKSGDYITAYPDSFENGLV